MHVDGKTAECCAGALRSLRARPTTFAGSDVGVGAIPSTPAAVVELLPCGVFHVIVLSVLTVSAEVIRRFNNPHV
jgi:hypothetical protein